MALKPLIAGMSQAGGSITSVALTTAGALSFTTAQTLTSAQGGQALTNINGATGATGNILLDSSAVDRTIYFFLGGTDYCGIFSQAANGKLVLSAPTTVTISPSGSGGGIQFGSAATLGTAQMVYIQPNGTATSGDTVRPSHFFEWRGSYWSASAQSVKCQTQLSTDTSGNALVQFTRSGGASLAFEFPLGSVTRTTIRAAASELNCGIYFPGTRAVAIAVDGIKAFVADANGTQSYIASFQGGLVMDILNRQLNSANSGARLSWDNSNVTVASGTGFILGNAAVTGLTPAVLAAAINATVVIKDSTGQAYRVPCVI